MTFSRGISDLFSKVGRLGPMDSTHGDVLGVRGQPLAASPLGPHEAYARSAGGRSLTPLPGNIAGTAGTTDLDRPGPPVPEPPPITIRIVTHSPGASVAIEDPAAPRGIRTALAGEEVTLHGRRGRWNARQLIARGAAVLISDPVAEARNAAAETERAIELAEALRAGRREPAPAPPPITRGAPREPVWCRVEKRHAGFDATGTFRSLEVGEHIPVEREEALKRAQRPSPQITIAVGYDPAAAGR